MGWGGLRHRQDDASDMMGGDQPHFSRGTSPVLWEPPWLGSWLGVGVGVGVGLEHDQAHLAALPLALRLRVAAPRAHVAKGAVRRAEGDEAAAMHSDRLAALVVCPEREDLVG